MYSCTQGSHRVGNGGHTAAFPPKLGNHEGRDRGLQAWLYGTGFQYKEPALLGEELDSGLGQGKSQESLQP